MYEISLNTNIISADDSGYEITGMINPEFHNDGDTDVVIQSQVIAPGQSFGAQFPDKVLRGTVSIRFVEAPGVSINKVILHFGKFIGAYTNPQTGLAYTLEQKQVIAAHNSKCN